MRTGCEKRQGICNGALGFPRILPGGHDALEASRCFGCGGHEHHRAAGGHHQIARIDLARGIKRPLGGRHARHDQVGASRFP